MEVRPITILIIAMRLIATEKDLLFSFEIRCDIKYGRFKFILILSHAN